MERAFSMKTKKKIRQKRQGVQSHYRLIVAYDGSGFQGWQMQDAGRTVQGELTRVAKAVFKQDVKIDGSGRTDAGVHATGQSVSMSIVGRIRPDKVRNVLNHSLPGDIRVLRAEEVAEDFHARYSAVGKVYVYRICNHPEVNVFKSRYAHYVDRELDLEKMRAAAKHFIGKHDFRNYSASNHGKKSTVRTVESIEITCSTAGVGKCPENEGTVDRSAPGESLANSVIETAGVGNRPENGGATDCPNNRDAGAAEREIRIVIRGDGFLWKMVRMISQTLIDAGLGIVDPAAVPALLENDGRRKEAAPASGLYLQEVLYP